MWNAALQPSVATAFLVKRTANTDGYMIFATSNDTLQADFGTAIGLVNRWNTTYNVSSNLNQWIHCVLTRSSSNREFYVNGKKYASTTNVGVYTTSTSDLVIGADSSDLTRYHMNGRIGEVRIYPRALTAAQVFQNYNATKSKYINEAPDTAPKIGPGIVYDSSLLLNYDFGNRATYDTAQNLMFPSNVAKKLLNDYNATELSVDYTIKDPFGQYGGVLKCNHNSRVPGYFRRGRNIDLIAGKTYTFSFYFKNDTITEPWTGRRTIAGPSFTVTTFNPTFEANEQALDKNIPVGNGWYKQVYTFTPGYTQSYQTAFNVVHNQTPIGSFYIAGFQFEEGSVARTHIKTSQTAITAPTTVKNLSSSSYTGTINGATFNTDGSFQFDGTDDDIETGLSWTPANQFSFTMWFNLDTIKEWHNLVDMYNTPTLRNFQLFVVGDGDFRIYWGATSGTAAIANTVANKWYFGAFTCNGETGDLYRYGNGTTDTVSATAAAGSYSVKPLVLGRRGDSHANGFVDGKIGEFQFYNRELTGAEVTQNYNATRGKYGV
jgi:hypothetical protein